MAVSKRPIAAVILAAGDGTRMLSRIPKVIHALYGKPLIGHVLDAIRAVGIVKIVAVLGYRSDLVRSHLGTGVQVVIQRSLKGTGHAVAQALPKLKGFKGDVVILYGDTPLLTPQTVRGLIEAHQKSGAACTLLTAQLKDPAGYGRIVRDRTGRVVRIVEDADATQAERMIEEINVGAYCFQAKALTTALKSVRPAPNGEYYLTDTIAALVRTGQKLSTAPTRSVGEFMGINTRADLARVQTIMRSRILERFMLGGVTIIDPYTTYIDGSAVIGQDTVIYPHTVIEQGARIGKRCQVGPFCRIGPGTVLENDVTVANFVDLSRSRVGAQSKILHHSYINRARIGKRVTVGAGTVTALGEGHGSGGSMIRVGDRVEIEGGALFLGPVSVRAGVVVPAGSALGRKS